MNLAHGFKKPLLCEVFSKQFETAGFHLFIYFYFFTKQNLLPRDSITSWFSYVLMWCFQFNSWLNSLCRIAVSNACWLPTWLTFSSLAPILSNRSSEQWDHCLRWPWINCTGSKSSHVLSSCTAPWQLETALAFSENKNLYQRLCVPAFFSLPFCLRKGCQVSGWICLSDLQGIAHFCSIPAKWIQITCILCSDLFWWCTGRWIFFP